MNKDLFKLKQELIEDLKEADTASELKILFEFYLQYLKEEMKKLEVMKNE